MAGKLVIAPQGERDIAEAYGWYEAQRAGLGEEFLGCVDDCVGVFHTSRNPDKWRKRLP